MRTVRWMLATASRKWMRSSSSRGRVRLSADWAAEVSRKPRASLSVRACWSSTACRCWSRCTSAWPLSQPHQDTEKTRMNAPLMAATCAVSGVSPAAMAASASATRQARRMVPPARRSAKAEWNATNM